MLFAMIFRTTFRSHLSSIFCLLNSLKVNNSLCNCPLRDFCKYRWDTFSRLRKMPWVAASSGLINMHPHCPPVTDSRENTETRGWGIKLCEFSLITDKVINQITTLISEYLFLFLIPGISLASKANNQRI